MSALYPSKTDLALRSLLLCLTVLCPLFAPNDAGTFTVPLEGMDGIRGTAL